MQQHGFLNLDETNRKNMEFDIEKTFSNSAKQTQLEEKGLAVDQP